MIVNVDVYTKDVDAALKAFKLALECGANAVSLNTQESFEGNTFECLNLMFEADHTTEAISNLDEGPFVKDRRDL